MGCFDCSDNPGPRACVHLLKRLEICTTKNRRINSTEMIIANLWKIKDRGQITLILDIRRKQRTGIRTVLMPCSEIHAQSSSVIHVSQCLSRICLAFMPRATSRSLCAGWRACWKGLSAIQRSRTNQEPALVRMGSGQEETERKTHQDWRLFASDNGILVGWWCFHRVSPYWLGLHQHHRCVLVVWTCLGFFAWPSRVCSRSQPHCALHRCNGHATWKLGSEIPVSHTAECQIWSLKDRCCCAKVLFPLHQRQFISTALITTCPADAANFSHGSFFWVGSNVKGAVRGSDNFASCWIKMSVRLINNTYI